MYVWRISAFADLSGGGGLKFSARWHTAGRRIVYTADHPASALCEMLVHVNVDDLPDTYQLLRIFIPEALTADEPELPSGWMSDTAATRAVGDSWLAGATSALLRVPSAIVPEAWNVLINPLHRDAATLRIESVAHVPLDSRLR